MRAAISVAELTSALLKAGRSLVEAFTAAVLMALPTRIEIERDADSERTGRSELEALLREWAGEALGNPENGDSGKGLKKKPMIP